jgi:threonine synthase
MGEPQDFRQVVLEGLAPDGGLYVPENFPRFSDADLKAMEPLSYPELAVRVMKDFVAPSLSPGELAALVQESYSSFAVPEVTPLKTVTDGLQLLELFHGPTLAFKDVALQFLGHVFGHFANQEGQQLTVLGATSGDTGSAAIAGCAAVKGVRVFILYPHKRPSEIQRRQMTTVGAPNVHVIAVQGSFDDCQALVKAAFQDAEFKKKLRLTAVNSINWARIIAQSVYYFYAGLKAGTLKQPVNFVVPSGNFGNIYAGYVARRLGLPIAKLIAATNRNDSLARFINNGTLSPAPVVSTLSPSMDIQLPSNLERYLFDLVGRDGAKVTEILQAQRSIKGYQLSPEQHAKVKEEFAAIMVDDRATKEAIQHIWSTMNLLVDPHTAVGMYAAMNFMDQATSPVISLACAHPAKFPEIVRAATRQAPPIPKAFYNIDKKKERFTILPNSEQGLREFMLKHT